MKVTLSVIKADVGGYVGHSSSHPDVLNKAEQLLCDGDHPTFRIERQKLRGDLPEIVIAASPGTTPPDG